MAPSFLNHVGLRNFLHNTNIKLYFKILSNGQIMRLIVIVMLFSLIYIVSAKNNVKQLSESMGQEVIEIGSPLKELPMGLDEEPSAEEDSDDEKTASKAGNTAGPAKKDLKKTPTQKNVKKDVKGADKSEGLSSDDEEARVEKELSEIYKDTDYKSDSAEEKEVGTATLTPVERARVDELILPEDLDKPIGRHRASFKLQPASTDKESIERFRTSIDDLDCYSRQKLKGDSGGMTEPSHRSNENDAFRVMSNGILLITAVLSYVFICS